MANATMPVTGTRAALSTARSTSTARRADAACSIAVTAFSTRSSPEPGRHFHNDVEGLEVHRGEKDDGKAELALHEPHVGDAVAASRIRERAVERIEHGDVEGVGPARLAQRLEVRRVMKRPARPQRAAQPLGGPSIEP
jgi:hypothetical protein